MGLRKGDYNPLVVPMGKIMQKEGVFQGHESQMSGFREVTQREVQ